ncbi:MAG: hypothetical protein RLZZ76_29 [Candidatus Parcubacteria bacterium]|jgi:hypothetical protein
MSCEQNFQRVFDSFFAPMVAQMWSEPGASEEDVARLAYKLQTYAFPDDVVRKAESEALTAILAD